MLSLVFLDRNYICYMSKKSIYIYTIYIAYGIYIYRVRDLHLHLEHYLENEKC